MSRFTLFIRQFDWLLFGSLLLLVGIGLTLLYSASIGREGGDLSGFWKQFFIAVAGLIVLLIVNLIDFHTWDGISRPLYMVMALVLVLVLIIGQTVHTTRGWLAIAGWRFQPVEFAKIVGVLALASYFARRSRELDRLRYLLQSLLIVGWFIAFILLQPDFGSAAVIFAVWASLLFIIGVRREYLVGLILVGLGTFLISWFFLFKPYQQERLIAFVFPAEKVQSQGYNVRQAIIAVGSGELTGRGLGQGSQSQLRFLPEATTDFIFATLGEELGLAGVAVVFFLLTVIYYRLIHLLTICQDGFASFVVLGTTLLISIEIFINAGMNLGLFPVVGIPFPFLSAGGSALLAHLALFGVIENIARVEGSRGYRLSNVSAV